MHNLLAIKDRRIMLHRRTFWLTFQFVGDLRFP